MGDNNRLVGVDVARCLAIFGMVIVNFKIAQGADTGAATLKWFAAAFEGRAAALFVVLAGVGIAFATRRARLSNETRQIASARFALLKRAVLLLILGLAFAPIWQADILHFYGVYFIVAAGVFQCSDRRILLLAGAVCFLFPVLLVFFDYGKGWDWNTLEYHGFWTWDGMFRHLFFNGFHPVFPWSAFLIFGLWLGRQDLRSQSKRWQLFFPALLIWLVTESVFNWFGDVFFNPVEWGMSSSDVEFLFSTSVIPPMPQYMLAAGSMAVMVFVGSLEAGERSANSVVVRWLSQTGQLALSLYVLHVILGMGLMEATGTLGKQSIEFSLLCSLAFCVFALVFAVCWRRFFAAGPVESIFKLLIR